MKATQIIIIVFIVILGIGYSSAAGCKPKGKCRKKGGTCFSSSKCAAGSTKVSGKACKGRGCTCCSPQGGCECGKTNPSRVVNGQEVFPKYKYPWHVWIKQDNRFYLCGGSIINDRYILTAGHCISDYFDCTPMKPNILKVIVADHNKDSTADDAAETSTVSVSKVIAHPDYNCPELNNDIALLKLSKALDLSSQRVTPVCLPKDDSKTYQGEQAVVTGWGYTEGFGPQLPSLLQELELPIIKCPGPAEYGEFLTASMLCAGVADKGLDACNGDSGGPLVVKETNNRYVQVGIVSFGPAECTGPGIYTRVSKYLQWIKKKTKKAKSCSGRSTISLADTPHKLPFPRGNTKKAKVARAAQISKRQKRKKNTE